MAQNTKNINLKTAGFSIFNNPKNSISNSLGYSVSGVGDVDKDGLDDVIVGAPVADKTNDIDASIYIIYGNGTSSNIDLSHPITPIARIYDTGSSNQWGYSISGAGDFNGDGFPDVVIGAPGVDNNAGYIEIWYGSSAGLIYGFNDYGYTNSYFGYSVSGIGDIDNDGYDDIIVGAYNDNGGYPFLNCGTLYYNCYGYSWIYLGSKTNYKAFISVEGIHYGDQSGWSVSGAGDVNGDGYPDIIIGAPSADYKTAATDVGAAYVVYGNKTLHNINLSSLNSATGFAIYGGAAGSKTGYSVSGAGDVNGDGFADVIIGAPWINNKAGITYIIYGKSINTDINLTQLTENKGIAIYGIDFEDFSGYSVSNVGDINRDGYDDVIIGAPEAVIIAEQYSGVSYVIYGNRKLYNIDLNSFDETQGFRIFSYAPNYAHLGAAVSGAGDVNGDGYLDIIVGAPGNIGLVETGDQLVAGVQNAYVILGKSTFNLDTNVSTFGNTIFLKAQDSTSQFGHSVSNIGNFNGDVFGDVIIGAPVINSGAGACYVMFGNNETLENQLLAFTPKDFNPTSIPTVAPTKSPHAAPTPNPIASPTVMPTGKSANTTAGYSPKGFYIYGKENTKSGTSVSTALDMNEDGLDDIIIGAPGATDRTGIVYVIYGNKTNIDPIYLDHLQSTQGFSVIGTTKNDQTGYSVSGIGDFNNNGHNDIAIGAPGVNKCYIIFGSGGKSADIYLAQLTSNKGFAISGINTKDQTGWSIGGAGDFDKDGYADIIIGAPGAYNGKGVSYLIYGSETISDINLSNKPDDITQGFSIYGANSGDGCGWSVSGAGDVNNDGYDDIIIGSPNANNGDGISYIIYGKPEKYYTSIDLSQGLSATQGFIINGETNYAGNSGYSVSSAGDVNHDGYDDVIIGAPEADAGKGKAYLVYGFYSTYEKIVIDLASFENADPLNSKGFTIEGGDNLGRTGESVSGGGDINHDNFTDIIVGSPGIGSHSSYIVYGSQNRIQEGSTPSPTVYPTFNPTSWEHGAKVWTEDHPYAIPLMVFGVTSIPVLFSKQICFRVLEIWEPYKDDRSTCINAAKSYLYKACEYAFMSKYLDWKEENERNQEVLLRRASNQIEKSELDGRRNSRQIEMTEMNAASESRIPEYIMESGQATNNPLRDSQLPSLSESSQSDEATEIARQKRASYRGDGNNKKSCVVCSIDAMMDPEHVRLQNEEFAKFGENLFGYNFLTENQAISATKAPAQIANTPTKAESTTTDNAHSSPSNNNLMISLLSAQQIVEYIPIIKYIAHGFNLSLPEVLGNKSMLITSHLILGNAAAALLPYESMTNGMITSTIATSIYVIRLVSAGYLVEQRQEVLSQDVPMSSFETLKYCGASMLAYTLPNLAKCAATKWFIPEAECSLIGYDLGLSASLAGADCYAMYKATSEPIIPTTADVLIPYIADAIAFAITSQYVSIDMSSATMAMQSVKQCMSAVASVVAVDYVGRVMMDIVPSEMKDNYVEPVVDYVENTFYSITGIISDNLNLKGEL
ncbi:MAG: FG-GAP-like repeat-containing protein [Rickettsiales bacterium]